MRPGGMTPKIRPRANLSLIGFLAMAFVVVGLTGILATYAAPLPLARALHLEAVLDQALARGDVAGINALAAEFAPRKAIAPEAPPADLPGRVAQLRARMREGLSEEAAAAARRLRLLIGVATLAGALFGAALMGVGRR